MVETMDHKLIVLINVTSSVVPMTKYAEPIDTSCPDNHHNITINGNDSVRRPLCGEYNSDTMGYYLNGPATAVVIALGIVGNMLAMIVLTRRTMRTSTNCFLTALAIWDSLVLAICFPLVVLNELSVTFRQTAFPYIVAYFYPVALTAQTATVWLTISFTVERYIAVCHPLKAARMCTIQRARIVIVLISTVSLLYNLPRWFEYTVISYTDTRNTSCMTLFTTPMARSAVYHKIYFGWLYFLVMCFIPLCTLAMLNAILIRAVKQSQKQRIDMNVRQSRENNVTIMLVFVVMTFIICQVPALIYNTGYSINMSYVLSSNSWRTLSSYRNFLVTLNSAVNFILYCALGQKFRRTFVRTLCPCVAQKMPNRFQSFSFHPNVEQENKKSFNGSYAKVGYKPCRTEPKGDIAPSSMDMKVLVKPKRQSRESNGSNGSVEPNSAPYQGSHKRLLVPTSV